MPNDDQYYEIKDLVQKWKMKEGFIRKQIRTGKLQCKHFGRSVRISHKQANDYIQNFVD